MNARSIKSLTVAATISLFGLPAIAADVSLSFDKITTVDADGDMSVCTKRYGSGYKTKRI
ncbi:hypothetical protein ROS1_30020 [Roseibium sp. ROS1]